MGRKNSASASQASEQEIDELQIQEKVQKEIKGLPTLQEKVQAIAINGYLLQKRKLDQELEKQTNVIECDYHKRFAPHLEEINAIIEGKYQFNDNDYHEIGELLTEQQLNVKQNYFNHEPISEYWLKAMMSSDIIGTYIMQRDQPLLKHLTKITSEKAVDGTNLKATFYFSENQWFSNESLTKQFTLDADTITKSHGDEIKWKEGKNITIKIVKKKQKNKKTGEKKTKVKQVREQSFFNLFRAIQINSDDESQQQKGQQQTEVEELQKQYEMVEQMYENLLPRSLEYYLGVVGGFGLGDLMNAGQEEGDFDDEQEEQAPVHKKKNKKKKQAIEN